MRRALNFTDRFAAASKVRPRYQIQTYIGPVTAGAVAAERADLWWSVLLILGASTRRDCEERQGQKDGPGQTGFSLIEHMEN